MKKINLLLAIAIVLTACKEQPKNTEKVSKNEESTELVTTETNVSYPENLQKVFDAHGGMNKWNDAQTLVYEMVKPEQREKHVIDLSSRKTRIEGKDFTIGYDGSDVWLTQKDSTIFKGNARFYHNLYFYFYAMPYVLGDDGITYSETDALDFEGVSYPGYKISYGENVGDSPEDNYFLYYHPETFRMEWLGYTVTYFNGQPSTKVSYIRYNDWTEVDSVVLPKSITWYKNEGNTITTPKNTVTFTNISLKKKAMEAAVYARPENAEVVPKE